MFFKLLVELTILLVQSHTITQGYSYLMKQGYISEYITASRRAMFERQKVQRH